MKLPRLLICLPQTLTLGLHQITREEFRDLVRANLSGADKPRPTRRRSGNKKGPPK